MLHYLEYKLRCRQTAFLSVIGSVEARTQQHTRSNKILPYAFSSAVGRPCRLASFDAMPRRPLCRTTYDCIPVDSLDPAARHLRSLEAARRHHLSTSIWFEVSL